MRQREFDDEGGPQDYVQGLNIDSQTESATTGYLDSFFER